MRSGQRRFCAGQHGFNLRFAANLEPVAEQYSSSGVRQLRRNIVEHTQLRARNLFDQPTGIGQIGSLPVVGGITVGQGLILLQSIALAP